MASSDSDDYELMPKQEIEDLRREVNSLKKNSLIEGDTGRVLIESIDRLTISINRMINILDDAQKDIIDEYQEAKPTEKLNQLLDQNEMIANALVAISDKLGGNSAPSINPRSVLPTSSNSNQSNSGMNNYNQNMNSNMGNSRGNIPQMPPMNPMPQQNMRAQQQMIPSPMDDLPPMDEIPPLDDPSQMPQGLPNKRKFLGIM